MIVYPKSVIAFAVFFCFFMAAIGFGTSYELVDDADEMWTPQDSYTVSFNLPCLSSWLFSCI